MSSGPNGRSDFASGKWTIWLDGFATAWSDPWRRARQATNPFEVHMIAPFGAQDGVKPVHMLNAAHLGATAIKKSSPDRIKELLRVLNYLAAPGTPQLPFGAMTEEEWRATVEVLRRTGQIEKAPSAT